MCKFEILSPRVDSINYVVPRWHVSSTSCILLVFGVKMMLDIIAIYHRELFPNTSCLWQLVIFYVVEIIDHLYIVFWSYLSYLLPSLCQLPFPSMPLVDLVFYCFCRVFSRYSESADPTLCILYSNANSL